MIDFHGHLPLSNFSKIFGKKTFRSYGAQKNVVLVFATDIPLLRSYYKFCNISLDI